MLTFIFSPLPLVYVKSIYDKDNGQENKYAVRDLHVLLYERKIYKYALNLDRVFNGRTFIQKAKSLKFISSLACCSGLIDSTTQC